MDKKIDLYQNSTEEIKEIKKLIKMSKDIVDSLGYYYENDNYSKEDDRYGEYSGYGLEIFYIPTHEYSKQGESLIKYNDTRVFDSYNRICQEGIWKEVFNKLHYKLPIFEQQKIKNREISLYCSKFMQDIFFPLYDQAVRKINESLSIGDYAEQTTEINNCGSFIYDQHYYVRKDDIKVLDVIGKRWHKNFSVIRYNPGSWEKELEDYKIECNRKKEQKDVKDGYRYIKELDELEI